MRKSRRRPQRSLSLHSSLSSLLSLLHSPLSSPRQTHNAKTTPSLPAFSLSLFLSFSLSQNTACKKTKHTRKEKGEGKRFAFHSLSLEKASLSSKITPNSLSSPLSLPLSLSFSVCFFVYLRARLRLSCFFKPPNRNLSLSLSFFSPPPGSFLFPFLSLFFLSFFLSLFLSLKTKNSKTLPLSPFSTRRGHRQSRLPRRRSPSPSPRPRSGSPRPRGSPAPRTTAGTAPRRRGPRRTRSRGRRE